MFLLDYLRQRWVRKGGVVEAGIPPESRLDALPAPLEMVRTHLAARPELPQDEDFLRALSAAVSDPAFLQDGPSGTAVRIRDRGFDCDATTLTRFLTVLMQEVTRKMYIDAARSREGAKGIRLFPEASPPSPEVATLTSQDRYGLGPGVYPFDAVPANPTPGRPAGFYVRVELDATS